MVTIVIPDSITIPNEWIISVVSVVIFLTIIMIIYVLFKKFRISFSRKNSREDDEEAMIRAKRSKPKAQKKKPVKKK